MVSNAFAVSILMARLPPKDFLGNKLMVSEVKLDRYDL
jgi:hypothetical protein